MILQPRIDTRLERVDFYLLSARFGLSVGRSIQKSPPKHTASPLLTEIVTAVSIITVASAVNGFLFSIHNLLFAYYIKVRSSRVFCPVWQTGANLGRWLIPFFVFLHTFLIGLGFL
jgi:hypothetical protein